MRFEYFVETHLRKLCVVLYRLLTSVPENGRRSQRFIIRVFVVFYYTACASLTNSRASMQDRAR